MLIFTIYGSEEHLRAFEKQLKDAGFDNFKDDPITSDGIPKELTIRCIIVPGFGNYVKKALLHCRLRLVSTQKHIVIKGDLAADEIERLIKSCTILTLKKG